MRPFFQTDVEVPTHNPSDRFCYLETIPFGLVHLACFAAIFTGVHVTDLLIAVALYMLRMFGITAGYHRYFSHRSFKTSRVFGFVLAFLAQSSAQRGVLWWAGKHRHHHRYSDTQNDVHSPIRRGFWYSHLGWFFNAKHGKTDLVSVPDLATYPELRWLDRHPYLPAFLMGFLVWLMAGWSGLVVGFFWSTVALWHATFAINSLAHVLGHQRYLTGDQSRNNWWLALLTFGEGWHNNHHHYQSAARQGFRWYEVDLSYYLLRMLSAVGLVWELQTPPGHVVRNQQRLRRAVMEQAAAQLAGSFKIEQIAADLRAVLVEKRGRFDASVQELHRDLAVLVVKSQTQFGKRAAAIHDELEQHFRRIDSFAIPSLNDIRDRAAAMFVHTPSMNVIVERAREMLIENVCEELLIGKPALVHSRV